MQEKIYSIFEINKMLKKSIEESGVFQDIVLKGEISNFKIYNKYVYFSLKDKDSVIKANCFSATLTQKLIQWFEESANKALTVLVKGDISIYAPRGEYSFNVQKATLVGTGNIFEELKQLQTKLQKEGLFNKKRALPSIIKNIGIITSMSGAALHDMHQTIIRRNNFAQVYLFPTVVQGENAINSIVENINRAQNYDLDVLLIARGGGSIEDLWAFNSEKVARAVFASKIITISGVGHEVDRTTIDLVADKTAITPTAAAEFATHTTVFDIQNLLDSAKITNFKNLQKILNNNKQLLTNINYNLALNFENFWNYKKSEFTKLQNNLHHLSETFFQKQKSRTNELMMIINNKWSKLLFINQNNLAFLEEKITILNPLNILKKGYSIVYNESNQLVKQASDVINSSQIKIKTASDEIIVDIKNKE